MTKKPEKEKSMNKKVAKFQFKKRKYEVDLLLDASDFSHYREFDIFDVTDGKNDCVAHLSLPANSEMRNIPKLAKEELKQLAEEE